MLRRYKPLMIEKIVADTATPEFLANNDMRLYGLYFIAEKAVGTDNTSEIYVQIDGVDAIKLDPGEQLTWPQPPYDAGYMYPQDFKIRVTTNGDGVRVIGHELT